MKFTTNSEFEFSKNCILSTYFNKLKMLFFIIEKTDKTYRANFISPVQLTKIDKETIEKIDEFIKFAYEQKIN